jgi:hypothetical protein
VASDLGSGSFSDERVARDGIDNAARPLTKFENLSHDLAIYIFDIFFGFVEFVEAVDLERGGKRDYGGMLAGAQEDLCSAVQHVPGFAGDLLRVSRAEAEDGDSGGCRHSDSFEDRRLVYK